MNKKTKKSTVFHQFMVSYILLLIISVLIISGISFYKTYSIVYGNIREAHFASIEKLESTMQSIFDETDDISLSLQGWPTVKKIFTMSGSLDSSWVSTDDLFNIVYMLRKHKALHPYIDNIAIVFRDVDLVIDCNSPESTYEDFFDYRYSFESELFSGVDDLDFSKDSLLIPNCMVGRYSQPNQNKLLYMKAIPNASGTAKAMPLITMTPDDLARELSNNMTFDEDMWLITDQNSNIILSGMKISEEDLNILPSFDETTQQTGYLTWSGKKCAYYYLSSQTLGQSFYTLFPLEKLMGQLLDTLLFMLCSLAITVGIGILLAFYYAKRNYAPIKKLASLSPTMQSDTAEIDEFTIIEESFQNLSSENDVLKNSIKAHMPMIRNNLLNKLLSNTRFEPADRKNLERYSIVFPEKHFVVSVVGIEIMNLHSEEALGGTPASSAVFFTYIEEYFKNANFIAYLTETQNGNYALILNCTDEQVKEYRSVLTKLLDFIRSKLSFDVEADISMGVSSIKEDPQNMKQLYYQALNALEYGYSMPATENDDATETPNIIWFDDLNEKQKVSYNFTFNDELKLMNLMKSSQKEETLAFTNSVLDDFFAQGRIKREDAIYIYNQILFICAKVIHETNARVTDIVDFKHLLSLSLFTQMNEYTLDCVSKTCDIIGQQQKSSEHELSGRILQYVRDNFRNYELTLTYIADHFHVSAIYVSKAVKKVSNISFIDYLNRLRIDEAKQMLSESDTSIRDIATAVGYDSDKNFIRVFKKYEGITPGQFRKVN